MAYLTHLQCALHDNKAASENFCEDHTLVFAALVIQVEFYCAACDLTLQSRFHGLEYLLQLAHGSTLLPNTSYDCK